MNGEGHRELKHGTHRSRVEAHIVETRDDELRKMDLLFYRGEVPKKSNNIFNTSKSNDRVSRFEGSLPQSGS